MDFLISAVIGYLFGSFPTAYLLVKKIKGNDITKEGSGNVGTFNSYEASKSKKVAGLVLLIDLAKGFLSTLVLYLLFPGQFIYPALALLFAVLSHCYNPWIKFKGGSDIAYKYAVPKPESAATLLLVTASVLIIIFIKHIEPLKEIISNQITERNIKR
jgi:glycerol-3-phosphate acyltransferase PlsY